MKLGEARGTITINWDGGGLARAKANIDRLAEELRANPDYLQRLAERLERHAKQGMLVNTIRYHMMEPLDTPIDSTAEYADFDFPPEGDHEAG